MGLQFQLPKNVQLDSTKAHAALDVLLSQEGAGSEFTGWLEQPTNYDQDELTRILALSKEVQNHSDVLVCIGIGGSYLGTKAILDALLPTFAKGDTKVLFLGQTLSSSYTKQVLDYLRDKDFSVNVISKSGTTTEPAVAYRLVRKLMREKYSKEEIKKRTFITTDKEKGALKGLATEEGFETFVVPDEIGGRYSFLTAVGFFPLAVAGIDVHALIEGAKKGQELYQKKDSDAVQYAAMRNAFYEEGKKIELFVCYEPNLIMIGEWFKQLFGESEGKGGKGIFPASVQFTTDLHSMGQMIQDGERTLFETVLWVDEPEFDIRVPKEEENTDDLAYLEGTSLHTINEKASTGVKRAHEEGGVPNAIITLDRIDAENIGQLLYFYMYSCGISAYMLGVNPFDQPGVEAYKKSMFQELGKPGYEG